MSFVKFENYEPAHLSYSTMDGFRTCGKRTHLQKVLQVEQQPGLAGLAGNAVHAATELYDLGEAAGDAASTIPSARELFVYCWEQEVEERRKQSPNFDVDDYLVTGRAGKEWGGKKTVKWWMQFGPEMVQSWIDWRTNSGFQLWHEPDTERPAVETSITFTLPNGIPILVYIDRILVSPAGQLVVVDIKTGRVPETPEQLGLYACAIEAQWGTMFRPDWGYWWTPDKGHSTPMDLGRYTPEYFAEISTQVAAGMNAGVWLAKPQNGCANWCGVARACTAVGGSLDRVATK